MLPSEFSGHKILVMRNLVFHKTWVCLYPKETYSSDITLSFSFFVFAIYLFGTYCKDELKRKKSEKFKYLV